MDDEKRTIVLLCRHIEQCTGVNAKPEYFRMAKHNEGSSEAVDCFWSVLNILSSYAVRDIRSDIDLQHYDKYKSTKIYLAYLQYPGIEFYGLLENHSATSRELLLALAWLIGIHNALETAMKFKLIESMLSREYMQTDDSVEKSEKVKPPEMEEPVELPHQINSIIHKCGQISNNFKEITELMSEKVRLTTKVHAATPVSYRSPHLDVPELSIIKKYFTSGNKYAKEDEESVEEFQRAGVMIESHMEWQKREKFFFDWMVTVLEEHKIDEPERFSEENIDELSTFISIIRHLIKKKIHASKHGNELSDEGISKIPCTSRFSRTQEKDSEAKLWNLKIIKELNQEEINVAKRSEVITEELKVLLKAIPDCIQI